MTSKNLCFKLMKEDIKRRVWTLALTILGFLFTILIPVAIKCSEFKEESPDWNMATRTRMVNNIVELLGVNGMAVAVLIAAGVLWAVSGFHYLHNSKKVDFYHSIPVKRQVLFLSAYLNGILIPAVIYAAVLAPSVALAVEANVGINHIRLIPLQYYVINMVYYSMLYTTAVIAMMMTGNVVVALLGDAVFWAYGPAVTALVKAYFEVWFHTYYETAAQTESFLRFIKYSSPFANYMNFLFSAAGSIWRWGAVIGAAAVTVALAILAYSLYRIRPSEAAGKAMAFKKTEMPIKVLLVIPIGLAFGMLFFAIRGKIFWLVFGTMFGVLLTHSIMEIIYRFDFRKLFSNRIHLGACMAAAVALALAGYYDWYGYDSWMPDGSKVADVAICMGYQDNWVTYGAPVRQYDTDEEGVEKERYYWQYQDTREYILENMVITDTYPVIQMAKKGVWADGMQRKKETITCEDWIRCIIQFRMKNGEIKIRSYSVPIDEETREAQDLIHDNVEYKRGQYPLLKQTVAETALINFQQYNQIQPVELQPDDMGQLLNVYQKELEALTMDTRRRELPVGTIQFMTTEHKNACDYEKQSKSRYYNLENRCYYPIYPSFTRTLELLKKAGISFVELDETMLEMISVYYRRPYTLEYSASEEKVSYMDFDTNVEYTKPEDIHALAPALCFQDYCSMNEYYEMDMIDQVDVSAVLKQAPKGNQPLSQGADERREYGFYLDKNKLSDQIWKKYHFDIYED